MARRFQFIHENEPEIGVVLSHGMTQASNHTSVALAKTLDLDGVQTVGDVGGHGHLLRTILEHHPHVRGVLFDHLDLDRVVDLPLPLPSRVFRRLARHVMTVGLRSEHVRVRISL